MMRATKLPRFSTFRSQICLRFSYSQLEAIAVSEHLSVTYRLSETTNLANGQFIGTWKSLGVRLPSFSLIAYQEDWRPDYPIHFCVRA
jgi:hypothetical protein